MVNAEPYSLWSRLEIAAYHVARLGFVAALAVGYGAIRPDPGLLRAGLWLWGALQALLAAWVVWNAEVGHENGDRRRAAAVMAAGFAAWPAYALAPTLSDWPGVAAGLAILTPVWGLLGYGLAAVQKRDRPPILARLYVTLAAGLAVAAAGVAIANREGFLAHVLAAGAMLVAAVHIWRPTPRDVAAAPASSS
jgi:hypothetical protein